MDEADQFESVGLDDSVEDERDFDQIMEDRRAAEVELDNRDGRASNRSKLPQLLHDQGNHFTFLLPFHFNSFIINSLISS
jgi:DNA replication licensing factor MCM2